MDSDTDRIVEAINGSKASGFHYKTWFTAGMGFFTDAYDLFIIGVVLSLLPLAGWHKLTTFETSLVASTALIAAVVGATIFGRLLDRLGRKAVYGLELIILVIGALGSAFLTPVNGVGALIAWRFLLGVGIGGDYATSSVIMSEYSNTKNRGRFVGMVFSMQSLGLVAGPLVALGFLTSGVVPVIAWRLLLAVGAIPAAVVIYYRRRMPEPPKYSAIVRGNVNKAAKDLTSYANINISVTSQKTAAKSHLSIIRILTDWRLLALIIGTAGSWFLMDWALYGNSIMSSEMLGFLVPSSLNGLSHVIRSTELSALIFGVAAFPGYWIATFTLDRLGRKPIQIVGFAMMALSFGILGIFSYLATPSYVVQFLILYGISYFFIEFGPNVTTFVYPPEVFPISARGTGSGLAAAGGKIGAFIGTFLNLFITSKFHLSGLFLVLSGLAVVGLLLTVFLLPEPKGKDLEVISRDSEYLESDKVETSRTTQAEN
ncbi:MAG: MFS transporter [Candidatus Thermoplasmatota archaeon]|nr:MFS transporter [Candidatus Thermoplasmatota archaeon]MCL5789821.1 MFS transporter [Candidatus Thermoplasmatota archaeon]